MDPAVSVVYLVLPLALLLALVGVLLFAWAVRRGQFDDLETPALRMLDDDDPPVRPRDHRPPGEDP